jgi:hypothetical protein
MWSAFSTIACQMGWGGGDWWTDPEHSISGGPLKLGTLHPKVAQYVFSFGAVREIELNIVTTQNFIAPHFASTILD